MKRIHLTPETSPLPDQPTARLEGANSELPGLLAAASEAGLLDSDLHALRDLMEISGYQNRPAAHALVLALMAALEEGSPCVAATKLALVHRLQDFAPQDAPVWADRILEDLKQKGLPQLIGAPGATDRPILLHETQEGAFLYFQKYWRGEQTLNQEFQNRLRQPTFAPDSRIPQVLHEVLHQRPARPGGKPLQLDADQQAALGLCLAHNLAIISGGPGTGKTSIVFTLMRCLTRLGIPAERMALAAPSGRAAQRLGDALAANLATLGEQATQADQALGQVSPQTLHQLLGYLPYSGQFRRHQENPLDAEVVVVDEVSMVGIEMMARLFEGLKPDTRLVLLGDKDQLPAVEAGAVLAHWLPGQSDAFSLEFHARLVEWFGPGNWPLSPRSQPVNDRVVLLKTNHRSKSDIQTAAQAINAQDQGIVDRLPVIPWPAPTMDWPGLESRGGCWCWPIPSASSRDLHAILDQWAQHTFLDNLELVHQCQVGIGEIKVGSNPELDELFTRLERYRLLTLVREGTWGVQAINAYLAQKMRQRMDRAGGGRLFAGASVLITRNDREGRLYNGDLGLAARGREGGLRVVFRRNHQYATFPPEDLPPHEFGFAMTVHKSQGSEYDQVLVILPPEAGRRLLTKELVYTALTRAKKLAIFCGSKESLRYAIGRRIVREGGFLGTMTPPSPSAKDGLAANPHSPPEG